MWRSSGKQTKCAAIGRPPNATLSIRGKIDRSPKERVIKVVMAGHSRIMLLAWYRGKGG